MTLTQVEKDATKAWQFVKNAAKAAAGFVTANAPAINKVVGEVSTAAVLVDPALTPVVTAFDTVEETVMAKLSVIASDVIGATSLSTLFGESWPEIQAILSAIKTPTVPAASTTT